MKKFFFVVLISFLSVFLFAESNFAELVEKYKETTENDDKGRVHKVISYDGTYDVFTYGVLTGKVERMDSYDSSGNLTDSVVFFRDAANGQLLGFKSLNGYNYFSTVSKDNNVFMKGTDEHFSSYNTFFSSLILASDEKGINFKYLDNNLLEISKNGNSTVYDERGRIVKNNGVVYNYNEETQELETTELLDAEEKVKERTYFSDGAVTGKEEFDNGTIKKKTIYSEEGNTEEYYENGVLYAKAVFFSDNKRVKSVEYVE